MAEGTIRVVVAYSPAPREVAEWQGEVPPSTTVRDALVASGLPLQYPEIASRHSVVGVWGRKARLDRALREGDRVEVYRPLTVDPKVARRERFRKQGAKTAGLFAQRRAGAKPGY